MIEQTGNLFDYESIVIPVNGCLKADGTLVMGAGVALEAAKRFPLLPFMLGCYVKQDGNHVYVNYVCEPEDDPYYLLISFPTKHHWKNPSDLALIERSAKELAKLIDNDSVNPPVYLPRVGAGLGKLDWGSIKPILDKYLDDRFIVLTQNKETEKVQE